MYKASQVEQEEWAGQEWAHQWPSQRSHRAYDPGNTMEASESSSLIPNPSFRAVGSRVGRALTAGRTLCLRKTVSYLQGLWTGSNVGCMPSATIPQFQPDHAENWAVSPRIQAQGTEV